MTNSHQNQQKEDKIIDAIKNCLDGNALTRYNNILLVDKQKALKLANYILNTNGKNTFISEKDFNSILNTFHQQNKIEFVFDKKTIRKSEEFYDEAFD